MLTHLKIFFFSILGLNLYKNQYHSSLKFETWYIFNFLKTYFCVPFFHLKTFKFHGV